MTGYIQLSQTKKEAVVLTFEITCVMCEQVLCGHIRSLPINVVKFIGKNTILDE